MIKFFRIIRQKLLHEKRVGKYLLYAFGEIILVIIGILIALNLNKASEANIQEKKIEAILRQIQKELNHSVEESNRQIEIYRSKDSLINLVMNHKLTKADFKKPENVGLRYLSISSGVLIIQDEGFKSLMLKSEILHDKYTPLVNGLKQLYIRTRDDIEFFNRKMEDVVFTTLKHLSTNYDWFADFSYSTEIKSDIALDYFYNDFNYRNSVMNYSNISTPFTATINSLRIDAIKYIREIDILLETDNTYSFDYDASEYASWIGKYHFEGDTSHIVINEDGLYRNWTSRGEPQKIYPLTNTKFHLRNGYFYVFHKDEHGEIIGYTANSERFRKFWEKIK